MPEREATELLGKISVGMWLRVSGRMELSYDGKDMQLNPQDIIRSTTPSARTRRRKSASSCTYIPVCPTWTR